MCQSGRSLSSVTTARSDFRSAFNVLDTDRDGKISRDDLRMFYLSSSGGAGVVADDDVIGSMMSVADFNKDGFVEYDEFERVLGGGGGGGGKKTSRGLMEEVFKVMDTDGDGKLSHDDLKSYMKWAGLEAVDDDIKAMIRLAGAGNDEDAVSFDDLIKILALDRFVF